MAKNYRYRILKTDMPNTDSSLPATLVIKVGKYFFNKINKQIPLIKRAIPVR